MTTVGLFGFLSQLRFIKNPVQDNSGVIENEELSGFLKDLLELVGNWIMIMMIMIMMMIFKIMFWKLTIMMISGTVMITKPLKGRRLDNSTP